MFSSFFSCCTCSISVSLPSLTHIAIFTYCLLYL
jgi:hypothetical protein